MIGDSLRANSENLISTLDQAKEKLMNPPIPVYLYFKHDLKYMTMEFIIF